MAFPISESGKLTCAGVFPILEGGKLTHDITVELLARSVRHNDKLWASLPQIPSSFFDAMKNLRTYFKVIFDSPKISDDNLRKFAEIHLQRLSAGNPGGIFTALITATTGAYQAYFGAIVDEATRAAIQKGMTLKMNNALDAFLEAARRQEGRIRAEYDKESAVYAEFYPQGLNEYNQASLADVEALMLRYAQAAERHVALLGQNFVDTFKDFHAKFTAVRTAQLLAIGGVKAEKTDTRGNRDALEDQLMDNLFTLAMKFKRDADAGMAYFDQSFLRDTDAAEEDADDAPPPPQA